MSNVKFQMSNIRSRLGFTLVELLATFTLISIVSGVGFASFMSYSRRQVVVQTAADLKQAIDIARFNAISHVKPENCNSSEELSNYKINICANAICQTSEADYEMNATCDGLEEVQIEKRLPQNVTLLNVTGSPTCGTLTFNIISREISGAPCEINVDGYDNQIKVSIDQNGHVSY